MGIIDEEGRLFGRVNVIDALVVVVALGLVTGGVFFVVSNQLSSGAGDEYPNTVQTRYATLTYTVGLEIPATSLSVGDRVETTDGTSFNVTDVHRSTTPQGRAHIAARIEYHGNLTVSGTRIRVGKGIDLITDGASVQAGVQAIDDESPTFRTDEIMVVVATEALSLSAAELSSGDEVRVNGTVVATVEEVSRRSDRRYDVTFIIHTRQTGAGPAFGGRPLRIGERIGLVTDEVALYGRVAAMSGSDAVSDG